MNRTAVDRLHGRKGYLAQLMDTVRPWAGRFDAERLSLTKRKIVMSFFADAGIEVQLVNICEFLFFNWTNCLKL